MKKLTKHPNARKKRVPVVFTEDWVGLIDYLMQKTGATSRAEVIRHGIELLDWVNFHLEKGYNIVAIKEEGSGNGKVKKTSSIGMLGMPRTHRLPQVHADLVKVGNKN